MTGMALFSLRHRLTATITTFITVTLGALVMGTFTPLIQLALDADGSDRETLITMGAVVGGWGIIIVLFSVASAVGITVGQREVEIGALRTVGALPSQVRRLVRTEVLVVAAVGATLGAVLASLSSRGLLAALRHGDMVSDGVHWTGGTVALVLTALVVVVTSGAAASVASRRATGGPATVVPSDGRPPRRMRRWRVALAVVLIAYASSMAVVAATDESSDPYTAMAMAGSLALLVGVALSLVGPALLAAGARLLRPALGTGPSAHLAAHNTSRRAALLSGVLSPVIILTAAAVSILMAVGTDHRTLPAGAGQDTATITLLNNVVGGMICAFAAIMVLSSFTAALAHRRQELRRLGLLGATRQQVARSVIAESVVVAMVGVALGLIASLFTIVPFGIARGEGIVPDGQLWLPPLLAVGVIGLTLGSARFAFRRVDGPR